ncbi:MULTISPECIES: DUF3055 domain-containing protein [Bacillaceae]|uniref:DUF3055 domain-containing protein n=1 Tax=Evansella alkalicola TaxID=745819 RepID=A0ABS6JPK9_9BACI|nr:MULTISPECIES: DUF3055 domain-containing protein [Bacillaceae]MBU9720501.1 DUF3055 domain-containing protein [Bacillus alkalicola]
MEQYERLYDDTERVNVRFIGMTTELARYDFSIMYTNSFFGKPLITCMQTGRSFLMCANDAEDVEHIQQLLHLSDEKEAISISDFFKEILPLTSMEPQYTD